VHRHSAIALRLGGAFVFFGLPPSSFVANNDILQQALAHPCFRGWITAIPSPTLVHLLKFSCSCRYPISILFEGTADGTEAVAAHK
jgi:hypothetical protein